MSLSQSQYSVAESDGSLTGTITMSNKASKSVTVQVTISDGSAKGNLEQYTSECLNKYCTQLEKIIPCPVQQFLMSSFLLDQRRHHLV